ncbi:MAG: adenine phosphoribosyltransferase [Victivallaceae bacterium]|nr:adenine phosphoribosyltransferase [Victivallaceae bacterium]
MSLTTIKAAIRDIPDFPKPGIIYKDITPLLKDPAIFAEIIEILSERYCNTRPDYIAGIESRGFIFGAALALKLGCGFIPVRKAGKLPYKTVSESYQLEYGSAEIEVHVDAVEKNAKVILVDDLLATGGTAVAAVKLLKQLNADIIGVEFIIELAFLNGRSRLDGYTVNSLIT